MRKVTKDEFDDLAKKVHNYMNLPKSMPNPPGTFSVISSRISPTDVGAGGMYPYQEPEVDEQGTYYGYKILHTNPFHPDQFISPRHTTSIWIDGELEADREPEKHHMHGIHCTKRPDHPELKNYIGRFRGSAYSVLWFEAYGLQPWYLVKCALSGMIVETEQGFRAQHAQIIGVLFDGNWKSYQDYQECAQAYSRPTPEPWQDEKDGWKYRNTSWQRGYWNLDPNP